MSIDFPELAAIRLGYGLSPLIPPPASPAAVLEDVATVAGRPAVHTTAEAAARDVQLADLQRATKADPAAQMPMDPKDDPVRQMKQDMAGVRQALLAERLRAGATARVGFGERLVQFWFDHFTVAPRPQPAGPIIAAFLDEAIRPNIGGTFLSLFTAAETHPAMLVYLEQNRSVGDRSIRAVRSGKPVGVNENLAREMLELHSLGVGAGYSQDDVRQLAYLLTGLTYDPRRPEQVFNERLAQPGAETVLGKSYGGKRRGGMDAILEAFADIVNRPETARFIARKLAVHFVSDEPDEGLVADLAAAWGKDGDLPALYAVLVGHPQLAAQFRAKVRQPLDFLTAALRALGTDDGALAALPQGKLRRWFVQPLARMGQPWLQPSGPNGWKEAGAAWINPQLLAERIDWAMNAPRALQQTLPDPRAFLRSTLGDTASEALAWAVPRAESMRDGVGIVLASNDFNRR